MTREEAYKLAMRACEETWNEKTCKQIEQALKQEPCEESISREDALMALTGEWTESTDELIHRFIRRIKKLPSVTPIQKSCDNVLDKIRAEITDCLKALDEIEKSELNIYLPNEILGRRLTYQQCLGFIDKYKAERISDDLSCDDMAENGLCRLCGDKDQCAADIDELSREIVSWEKESVADYRQVQS